MTLSSGARLKQLCAIMLLRMHEVGIVPTLSIPISLGADLVWHSCSHAPELADRCSSEVRNVTGMCLIIPCYGFQRRNSAYFSISQFLAFRMFSVLPYSFSPLWTCDRY